MHPAQAFQETDEATLIARAGERGFAIVISVADSRPLVAHAPVLVESGRLRFHLSAANPLSTGLKTAGWALAVISGDDAYVSPDWYSLADQVPTWNYLSVEIEGPVRVMTREDAIELLDDLSAKYEANLAPKAPWTRGKMNPARFDALLAGIVAFEMKIERLAGITKLSQNKPNSEVERLAAAMAERSDDAGRRIAEQMLRRLRAD